MKVQVQPTDIEHTFSDDTFLVSKTDPRGIITYANTTFIHMCGYSEMELLKQPHNIVRHPDMPKAAFKDLWDTVETGKEWHGIVKNLRKDGGFYWVDATVTPTMVDGKIVGYMSVRRKPTRKQIDDAAALYRTMIAEERS
ncbi:PAS domain-containing protein [Pelagicoccus albus]|uniref:PAS domain-containing protein n=1 Tax=Pelagicoccus albus TaxID=415222 RepID=A0A7X1E995_9BACT|nr:PAS domain-containing protein [Pelagicoccus albus]MBC2605557.1 PAS domain-containing protein [Pelagicoccus albus]